ncbi:surface carbohydrate biosynthesis protein [Methylophilus methylotrophus]|uniref:surface carbohydrate biosynthesis protein n=1 Tax=Methylophilus methylotrophus TaxID=17 RepID=UPI000F59302A|nr:surface carbohydrate biosynthesis protein [Methylophilus methylotrophus]
MTTSPNVIPLMTQLTIAIIVDNPKRDLRGLTLLSHELVKRGARVLLVPMYQQGYDLPLLAPDIVIVNYARDNNRALLETYKHLNYRIAVLDTEGGVLSEDGADSTINWAKNINITGLGSLIDYYCFWGSEVYKAFHEYSGIDNKALAVTGCPRYDLCCVPWSAVLSYKRKDFILVNTNFSAINPQFTKSAEDESRIFKQLGWDEAYIDSLFDALKAVFPKYLDTIEHIAQSFPDRIIQIRPHPFENPSIYVTRFSNLKNIIIDGDGDIFDTISASSCIVHLNCGSSVDALRLNKLPISLEYLNNDCLRNHAPLPSKLSCQALSREMLVHLLTDIPQTTARFDFKKAFSEIEHWYYLNDGKAAARIADFLMSPSNFSAKISQTSYCLSIKGGRSKTSLPQLAKGMVGMLLGSKMASFLTGLLISSRSHKNIDLLFVKELLARFIQLDDKKPVRIQYAKNPYSHASMSTIDISKAQK